MGMMIVLSLLLGFVVAKLLRRREPEIMRK